MDTDKPASENTEENTGKRGRVENLILWQPGQSGNPGGRPKKKPITEMYEELLSDPDFAPELRVSLRKVLTKGGMGMVLQLKEMAERVEGKVTQDVKLSGEIALSISERMRKARERVGE